MAAAPRRPQEAGSKQRENQSGQDGFRISATLFGVVVSGFCFVIGRYALGLGLWTVPISTIPVVLALAAYRKGSLGGWRLPLAACLLGAVTIGAFAISLGGPKDASASNERGVAKQAIGNLQGALVDFNEAVRLNSEHPLLAAAIENRGFVKRDLGDRAGAIQDFEQAVQLYRRTGMTTEALEVQATLDRMR